MTKNHRDYSQELLQDLVQYRAQQSPASASSDVVAPDPHPASARLYNRLNRSEPNVRFEPRPPDQPKPDHAYHQRAFYFRASLSQQRRLDADADVAHEDAICSEAPFPANMLESYRHRDHERRVQAGLPPARSQQRERYTRLHEQLRERSGSLNSIAFESCRADPFQGLSELCENEQKLYDDIFKEVIQNESNRCMESGQLLEEIRHSYREMFMAVPHYIKKAQHNVNQTNTILAQLEHQVQLNRDLEARLSLLESEQEMIQHERESWSQEKQATMDDHAEFQYNFLQLRNFWDSERSRYEQQVKTLKKSLQERQHIKPDHAQNPLIEKMDSMLSSALDILDSAPNLTNHSNQESPSDLDSETRLIQLSSINASDSPPVSALAIADSAPCHDEDDLSDLECSKANPHQEEESIIDLRKTEHSAYMPKSEFESDQSPTETNVSDLLELVPKESLLDQTSPDTSSISAVSLEKDLSVESNSPSVSIAEPIVPQSQFDHTNDHRQLILMSTQNQIQEIPTVPVSKEQDVTSTPAVSDDKFDSSEIADRRLEGPSISPFDQSRGEPDDASLRFSDPGPVSSMPSEDKHTSKSNRNIRDSSLNKPVQEPSRSFSTLGQSPNDPKIGLSLDFDKIRSKKERSYDLNSIEYFDGPSLKPRSLVSPQLSTASYPGWVTSTPVPSQSPKVPQTPRFGRRRPKLDFAIKNYPTSSLQNLLKQARSHQHSGNVMTEPNLLKLINFILDSCYAATIAKKEKHRGPYAIDLQLYTIGLMKEQHGLAEIILAKWGEMMNSIRQYRSGNMFIDLFSELLEGESDLHVKILLRIRQLLTTCRHGVSLLIHDEHYVCQDRAIQVIKSLFSDFITSAAYQRTTALVTEACRPWADIVHELGSLDVIKRTQILSPRLNLNMMDVINPHDKRFSCNEYGIEVNRFIPLAYQGIRRAELEYERDQWARRMFQSVDHNNDHFISFEQFSRAFSSSTIPQLTNRQLQVLFDKTTQQAATKQMSLERFRHVCSQLKHVIFINTEDFSDEGDHLRPTLERIIARWTRLDPAYNKFVELMCNTKSGFDICQRLSYARLVFEGALIYGAKSSTIIDKYRLMLSIIAESPPDPTMFMTNATLIRDIDRLEKLVDLRLKVLPGRGPGMVIN